MIPKVRTWKVTATDTGKVIWVDTINKRFARWIANTERGMWGHDLSISVVKSPFAKDFNQYGFSQPVGLDS